MDAFHVAAQSTESDTFSFTLTDAIEYAQKHQLATLNAKIDEEIAKNTVKQTLGIGLPQLSGSINFQDFIDIPTEVIPSQSFGEAAGTFIPAKLGTNYQSAAALNLSQLLFDGSFFVGLQASKTYRELSTRNLKRTRIETAVAVIKAYYTALVTDERLTLIDANLKQLKKSLHDTKAMFDNGLVEKIDVERLSVLKNNSQTDRENAVRLLSLNIDLLKFQMGMPVQAKLMLRDSISSFSMDSIAINADTTAYKSRIEYSILQTNKRLSELDLKRYKSQFLPSVSFVGNTTESFQAETVSSLYGTGYPSTVIGLNISIPLISGGQRLYAVRNARLGVLKAKNNITDLKNSINFEISQSQTNYVNGMNALENQKRNMELAKHILDVSRAKYAQGVGSSLEVTTAETSLTEAQNNYVNALYDMLINKVNLDKALGKINY